MIAVIAPQEDPAHDKGASPAAPRPGPTGRRDPARLPPPPRSPIGHRPGRHRCPHRPVRQTCRAPPPGIPARGGSRQNKSIRRDHPAHPTGSSWAWPGRAQLAIRPTRSQPHLRQGHPISDQQQSMGLLPIHPLLPALPCRRRQRNSATARWVLATALASPAWFSPVPSTTASSRTDARLATNSCSSPPARAA